LLSGGCRLSCLDRVGGQEACQVIAVCLPVPSVEADRVGVQVGRAGGETVCDLVLVGVGAGELAAVVDAATDGLAAVALAAISPELLPGCLFWIEG
jgi:hypothetical protein